jgi:hypothetical protein
MDIFHVYAQMRTKRFLRIENSGNWLLIRPGHWSIIAILLYWRKDATDRSARFSRRKSC